MATTRSTRHLVLDHTILVTTNTAIDGCGTTWAWRTVAGPKRAGGAGHSYDTARGAREAALASALTVLGSAVAA